MGRSLRTPKDIVRDRSEGLCEKCGVELTRNVDGVPDGLTARSIHHRQPKRCGGKDSVVNLVNICIGCHRQIHEDEALAERFGWIVIGRYPGNVPYLTYRGWVIAGKDGSLVSLDFDLGRTRPLAPALVGTPDTTRRHRVARRQRHRARPVKAGRSVA
jgi:hypothetical protein